MKCPRSLIEALKVLGVAITASAGAFGVNYHYYHRVSWDTGDALYLRKVDGLIAHSELAFNYQRNEVLLESRDPLGSGYRRYSDSDKDGVLDWVEMEPSVFSSGDTGSFSRKKHAQTHADLLKQENANYQEELKDFQEQFPQEFQRFGLEKIVK